MAAAFLNSTSAVGTSNSVTTGALDTTTAKLIVIGIAFNQGATPTISDSKGNTWTALTASAVSGACAAQMYSVSTPQSDQDIHLQIVVHQTFVQSLFKHLQEHFGHLTNRMEELQHLQQQLQQEA